MTIHGPGRTISTSQVILCGFAAAILLGSVLLMLPVSSRAAGGASFADALFTATSAVCVTGLVVCDTAATWSLFGQAVILTLIQIGGMGVVTLAAAVTMLSGKRIGLMQRSTMQEAISAHQIGGVVRLTGFIVRMTLIFEMLGALMLALVFVPEYGVGKGIWMSVFHAISAFCNAGFDLMGEHGAYSSLTAYVHNPFLCAVIAVLIIIGGIGFLTWEDVKTNKLCFRAYRMQSKMILTSTALLIALPAICFYFPAFSGQALDGMTCGQRLTAAVFQAITPRTAGFNTIDLGQLSDPGKMLIIVLMLIGGAPGSTAGGMKTTTAAVMLLTAIAVFCKEEETKAFSRRLGENVVRSAAAIVVLYMTLLLAGATAISALEGLPMMVCLFEAASAIGTVGLTLGVTPQLGAVSRVILVALMFLGRAGGLTVVFAAFSRRKPGVGKLPEEKVMVG